MSGDSSPSGGGNARRGEPDDGGPREGARWEDRRSPPPSDEAATSEHGAAPGEAGIDATAPRDPLDRGPRARADPPAFGVMLHLLGAAALALASLVWAGLLLFGVVASHGLKVLAVFAGLTLAVAWIAWLVRATMGREFPDDEPGAYDGDEHRRPGDE